MSKWRRREMLNLFDTVLAIAEANKASEKHEEKIMSEIRHRIEGPEVDEEFVEKWAEKLIYFAGVPDEIRPDLIAMLREAGVRVKQFADEEEK